MAGAIRILAALAALSAGRAAAFVRTTSARGVPLAWPLPVVPYAVNPAHPFTSPTCAAAPAGDPALAAVRASFDAWKQPCADIDLVYGGPIDEIRVSIGGTGENVVVFRQGWCSQNPAAIASGCMEDPDVDCGNVFNCFEDSGPGDQGIVALTSVLYDPSTGRIVDADMELNGWDGLSGSIAGGGGPHGWYFTCDKQSSWNACTFYGQPDCYSIDLQNTVTHEAGHFIGLRHPCSAGSPTDADLPSCGSDASYAATTMYPSTSVGDVVKRTLSADDIAGVCAIYPGGGGGCGCGAGGAPGAIAALVASLALWPRRRSTPPA